MRPDRAAKSRLLVQCAVVLLGLSQASIAQQEKTYYVSRTWRTQEGLPENRVRAIAQTPDGYLWIGTPSGLARFDGVRFVVFTHFNTPALHDDNIRSLALGRDGSLWAGTDGGGLIQHKDGRFKAFGNQDGLESEFVGPVLEDKDGALWVGTNSGLFRREGQRFVRKDRDLGPRSRAYFTLWESESKGLFAGGQVGVARFEKGRLRLSPETREREEVFRIREMRDGSLWLGTNQGLRAEGRSAVDFSLMRTNAIGALSEDHSGNVWIGTLGDGVHMVRNGQSIAVRLPATLPDLSVLAILEDRERAIWLGTADGLVRLTEPDVEILHRADGLSNENVLTTYCSQDGSVWLTTVTGEVYQYRAGAAQRFRLPSPADTLRILGVYEDGRGGQWFGTDNQGAVRLADGRAQRLTMAEGLRNNGIQFFHAGPDGSIWIGTTSGVSRWDGARLRNYYIEEGLSYGWVRAIAEDNNGDLLVGTDRGLNRIHEGKFVKDAAFVAVSRDRVWTIYRDPSNTLWLGARGGGLIRIRDGQARRLTTKDGLLSNSIFQILGGSDGRLWMSGPLGLSSATLADLNAAVDGRLDAGVALARRVGSGLESTQMNGGVQPAGCAAKNGELWFAGVKGAIHFKPQRPRVLEHAPVRMEGIFVDDRPIAASKEIVLGPGRQRVRFEFTSCTLSSPESVSFRYKLENFDGAWVPVTGPRSATYDNLPPGQYRFQVIARDDSSGNRTSSASVSVVITPHFYQTGWFYGVALAAVGVCVAGVFLLRERRARERYHLRLAERTRIAREMHDTVVQGCVGVSTLLEAAVGSAQSDQHQMLECLDNARIHLRLTLDEARQALTDLRFDSFEHGLAGALEELAGSVSAERGIPVTLECLGDPGPLADSTNRALLLVTREAIRNAVVHGAPTTVRVEVHVERDAIVIEVTDDGSGFATPAGSLTALGHFGIVGMRERLEQLGGSLDVASQPGAGTTVTIRVPRGG